MNTHVPLTDEAIQRLTANTEPWLSCDDCFEHLDVVIERLLGAGAPPSEAYRVHLAACAVCHEDALSLATLLAEDYGLTESEASARIDAAVESVR